MIPVSTLSGTLPFLRFLKHAIIYQTRDFRVSSTAGVMDFMEDLESRLCNMRVNLGG